MLPDQLVNPDIGAGVLFSNAPSDLQVKPWSGDDGTRAGNCSALAARSRHAQSRRNSHFSNGSGYTVSDVFFLEVCVFRLICSNSDDLFKVGVGEPFHCKFSHRGFLRLHDVMLAPVCY